MRRARWESSLKLIRVLLDRLDVAVRSPAAYRDQETPSATRGSRAGSAADAGPVTPGSPGDRGPRRRARRSLATSPASRGRSLGLKRIFVLMKHSCVQKHLFLMMSSEIALALLLSQSLRKSQSYSRTLPSLSSRSSHAITSPLLLMTPIRLAA